MPKKILVTGATGSQGGATVNALLEKGSEFEVFALVRSPDSDKAKALAAKGVTLLKGDFSNKESMVAAFKDKDGVFLVTLPDKFTKAG